MAEPIRVVIHGSTGSIGTQTLDVIDRLRGKQDYDIVALVCNSNIDLLEQQIRKYNPRYAVVADEEKAGELGRRIGNAGRTTLLAGREHATDVCGYDEVQLVVIGTAGFAGLEPTLKAIEKGKRIATANKETFLAAGNLVMSSAVRHGVEILPIDSEPSAMWQSIEPDVFTAGERHSVIWNLHRGASHSIDYFILTGSGGPFLKADLRGMQHATPQQALNHPTWNMGPLVTMRSATMMNKAMERIEASAIFGVPIEKVRITIHPQSILHSGVVLTDGSVKAQLGPHDMRYPIQYALTFPRRFDTGLARLSLAEVGRLDFEEQDTSRFPCLRIGERAGMLGGTAPAVLNGADETAVYAFLDGKIRFGQIHELIEAALDAHTVINAPTLQQIIAADTSAREHVKAAVQELSVKSGGRVRRLA